MKIPNALRVWQHQHRIVIWTIAICAGFWVSTAIVSITVFVVGMAVIHH
jgi:hypothetical protein